MKKRTIIILFIITVLFQQTSIFADDFTYDSNELRETIEQSEQYKTNPSKFLQDDFGLPFLASIDSTNTFFLGLEELIKSNKYSGMQREYLLFAYISYCIKLADIKQAHLIYKKAIRQFPNSKILTYYRRYFDELKHFEIALLTVKQIKNKPKMLWETASITKQFIDSFKCFFISDGIYTDYSFYHNALFSLYELYPNSTYASQAAFILLDENAEPFNRKYKLYSELDKITYFKSLLIKFPNHPYIENIYYCIGNGYFKYGCETEKLTDQDRLKSLTQAKQTFQTLIHKFPESDFVSSSTEHIARIDSMIAQGQLFQPDEGGD